MKNRYFIKKSIVGLLPLSLSMVVLFGVQTSRVQETEAYSRSTLPTTIDLNDNTDSEIRGYYSGLNSLSSDEKKGTNLLKNLKSILKNDQKYYSYEAGTDVWRMYEITDRDWVKSPASAINGSGYGSYDASTNIITGYKYGSSVSNPGSNPYVHAFYVSRSVDNPMTAWGNHDQTYGGINREHLWAKSRGFEEEGEGGARGDPFHLVAADGISNRLHNAYSFGYVDKTKTSELEYPSPSYAKDNCFGISKTLGSGKVFEPQDSDKGDVARALFYMAARYNAYDGDTNIDTNNPNLKLCNYTWNGSDASYTSTTTKPGEYGILPDLLEWNRIDPPDEYEIHRNNLLFKNFTNNRNPFIDFPYWAEIAFGDSTKNANPKSDNINSVSPSADVTSIAVTTQPSKKTYKVGEQFNPSGMVVTATYTDGSKEVVTNYTYSPNGALKLTDTTITITYEGKSTTLNIIVENDVVLTGIAITTNPNKITYTAGDIFDPTGMVVKKTFSDGSEEVVTDYTFSTEPLTASTNSIDIIYGDFTATIEISVQLPLNSTSFVMSELNLTDGQAVSDIQSDDFYVSFYQDLGTRTPNYNKKGYVSLAARNSFIVYGRYQIVKINLIFASNDPKKNDFVTDRGTYSNETNIWVGAEDDVTFTLTGESGTRYIKEIIVTFDPNKEVDEFTILDWVVDHWYIVAIVAGVVVLIVIIAAASKGKKKGKKHGKR